MSSLCTDEQAAAINAPFNCPVAIIACPGSGKTFTIIHRVAHLLKNGFNASDLLVITFTRKAAKELKSRLSSMKIDVKNLTVQTFHSFGLSILRKFKHLVNLSDFRIVNQKEQLELIYSIANSTPKKEILLMLQTYKTLGICNEELKPIFEKYNQELHKQNACDFTDLILLPLEILKNNPEVLKFYQRKFKYALVDEMQDVSNVQYELMKTLFGDSGKLTVVGDDDQTIYGWRGANAKLLLEFSKTYPNSKIIRLTKCFRCPPHIVKAMSKVINFNQYRVKKKIISLVENKSQLKQKKITIYGANSLKDEAKLIASDIKQMIGKGTIAVLFRTRKASKRIKEELRTQNVNASIYDRARYLESRDVNIVLNFLQMCVGIPYNKEYVDPNLLAIIKFTLAEKNNDISKKNIDEVSNIKKIADLDKNKKNAASINTDLHFLNTESDNDYLDFENTPEKEINFLTDDDSDFVDDLEIDHQSSNNDLFSEINTNDTDENFLKKAFKRMSPLEAVSIVIKSINRESKNFQFLLNEAKENEESTIQDFLYNIRTNTTEEKLDSLSVFLSTVHQAKGLEWDYVYVIGASKGSWPSQSSLNENTVEEERRLFYVAMSRAKKELTISFLKKKGQSEFIDEIPEILIKERIHRNEEIETDDNTGLHNLSSFNLNFQNVSKLHQNLITSSQPQFPTDFISANKLHIIIRSDSQNSTHHIMKPNIKKSELILVENE